MYRGIKTRAAGLIAAGALALGSGCSMMDPQRYGPADDVRAVGTIVDIAAKAGDIPVLPYVGLGLKLTGVIIGAGEQHQIREANLARARQEIKETWERNSRETQSLRGKIASGELSLANIGGEFSFTCAGWQDGYGGGAIDGNVDPSGREFVDIGRMVFREDEPVMVVCRFRGRRGSQTEAQIHDLSPKFMGRRKGVITSDNCYFVSTFEPGQLRPGVYSSSWIVSGSKKNSYTPMPLSNAILIEPRN